MDELRSISIFAKAVELGSFRAAAEAFKLSPSVVSYHISQLEERYDIALLYRSTRKLSLTAEGQKLYEHASAVARASEKCFDVLAKESSSPAGKLSLSVPAVLTESPLAAQIASFAQRYPKVQLSIHYTDARQDLIANGIDVAIRMGDMPDSNLKSRRIDSVHRKLVCSPDYYEARATPKTPSDLKDWSWIHLAMLPASRTFRNQKKTVKTNNQSTITVNSVGASCQLSIQGLGLSSPPDFMVETAIAEGRLVHVLPEWKMDDIEVYAVWPENVKRESIAGLFVAHLAASAKNV